MTTVLLATPYYPPNPGGVQQYVWNLARMLRERHGYRVVVVTTAEPGRPASKEIDDPDISVYRLPTWRRISNTPIGRGWVGAIRRIIHAEQVDLVNGHGPVPLFADAARLAAGKVPFVLTYHGGRARKGHLLPDLALAIYETVVLAATARRSREVICASQHVAEELPNVFRGRPAFIEPGADMELFPASPVPREPRIVFSASLERATAYKGLPDLLRAVAGLAETLPDVRLEVVGSGSAEPDYRELARRLHIADRVTFAGYLTPQAVAAAYRRARVLCLPTHFDNYPTVIVEAMATGRPIVSTRVGAIPTFVIEGETGLLVDAGDVGSLIRALEKVLTDDQLAYHMGRGGNTFVAEHLSWQRQSDRTTEVFRRAVDSRHRSSA